MKRDKVGEEITIDYYIMDYIDITRSLKKKLKNQKWIEAKYDVVELLDLCNRLKKELQVRINLGGKIKCVEENMV